MGQGLNTSSSVAQSADQHAPAAAIDQLTLVEWRWRHEKGHVHNTDKV